MNPFIYIISFTFLYQIGFGQSNCNLYEKGSNCYKACELYQETSSLAQGSKLKNEKHDECIALCRNFDEAWHEKSVAYLKRGDFYNWRNFLDTAVALNPRMWLGYRAACAFEFLNDTKLALADIKNLELLMPIGNLGYNANGDYTLRMIKALCLKEDRLYKEALQEMDKAITYDEEKAVVGTYDYLHRAVCKLQLNLLDAAKEDLNKELLVYQKFPDTYYYLALVELKQNRKLKALDDIQLAEKYYAINHRQDPYVTMPDQIFWSDIQELKAKIDALK